MKFCFCIKIYCHRSFVFELWVDNSRLLDSMDLATALASFFHVCFIFDLKYPKVKQFKKLILTLLIFCA